MMGTGIPKLKIVCYVSANAYTLKVIVYIDEFVTWWFLDPDTMM